MRLRFLFCLVLCSAGLVFPVVAHADASCGSFTPVGNVTITAGSITGGYTVSAGDATFTATMDWGDGGSSSVSVSPSAPSATLTHLYTVPGTYTVTLQVSGMLSDGTPCSDTVTIATANVVAPSSPGGSSPPGGSLAAPATFCPVASQEVIARTSAENNPPPPCQPTQGLTPEEKQSLKRSAAKSYGKAVVTCIVTAFGSGPLVPIAEALCAYYLLESGGDSAEALVLDPPDPNYWAIAALPAAPRAHAAASPMSALQKVVQAEKAVTALHGSLAITLNRFNTAVARKAVAAAALQYAAVKTISGVLARALATETVAERGAARTLRAAGTRLRGTAAQVQAERARIANLSGVPRGVLSALLREGLSRAQIQAAMAQTLAQAPTGPLNFLTLLGSPPATGGLLAAYRSMTFADVAQIVTSLQRSHSFSAARAKRLTADLRRGAAVCGARRLTAVRQLAADAAPGRNPLLTAAAGGLRFNHC